jgi:DNA repair protein RAD50
VEKKRKEISKTKDLFNSQLEELKKKWNNESLKLSQINWKLNQKLSLQSQIDYLTSEVLSNQVFLKQKKMELSECQSKLKELMDKKRIYEDSWKSKNEKFHENISRIQGVLTSFGDFQKNFPGNNSDSESLSKEIQNLKILLEAERKLLSESEARFSSMQNETSKIEADLRNITENLEYRKLLSEHSKLLEIITHLDENKLKNETEATSKELAHLLEKESRNIQEKMLLLGGTRQLRDQIDMMEKQMESTDVEQGYKEQFIKLKTLKMATADLEKFTKALDAAIMKFHASKMEEINRIVRELWMEMYQGSDIDTLEIRSDGDKDEQIANRTYRVFY